MTFSRTTFTFHYNSPVHLSSQLDRPVSWARFSYAWAGVLHYCWFSDNRKTAECVWRCVCFCCALSIYMTHSVSLHALNTTRKETEKNPTKNKQYNSIQKAQPSPEGCFKGLLHLHINYMTTIHESSDKRGMRGMSYRALVLSSLVHTLLVHYCPPSPDRLIVLLWAQSWGQRQVGQISYSFKHWFQAAVHRHCTLKLRSFLKQPVFCQELLACRPTDVVQFVHRIQHHSDVWLVVSNGRPSRRPWTKNSHGPTVSEMWVMYRRKNKEDRDCSCWCSNWSYPDLPAGGRASFL